MSHDFPQITTRMNSDEQRLNSEHRMEGSTSDWEVSSSTHSGAMQFKILHAPATLGPRVGRLALNGRKPMETPHYVGITSRGVVPHLSQDMIQKHTKMKGVYVALEDFIERASLKQTPPVFLHNSKDNESALRNFIALPKDQLLVLGARRTPPVLSPWPNQQTAVSISTAFGFGKLSSDDFVDAARVLKPDIVVALGDVPHGEKAGSRRVERMGLRTERWLKELLDAAEEVEEDSDAFGLAGRVFAPVLPVTREQQSLYLDILADEWRNKISGLAIYDVNTVPELSASLTSLPMLSLTEIMSPANLLREISLGLDIFTIPFLNVATDAGVALDFRFPVDLEVNSGAQSKPLGSDMWSSENSADLSPLVHGCDCYACSVHHRAYVQHLLSAKEMLAWILLQVHNIRILDAFFAGVRTSIARGTFDADHEIFLKVYESEIPNNSGTGPRVRGYQFKTEGPGQPKKNPKAYNTLDDARERNADAPLPDVKANAGELENRGFAKAVDSVKDGG